MTITTEQIAELRRLCSEATPGPWEWTPHQEGYDSETGPWGEPAAFYIHTGRFYDNRVTKEKDDLMGYNVDHDADAAFIAASRNAMPQLLDEVERLQELNADLLKDNKYYHECHKELQAAYDKLNDFEQTQCHNLLAKNATLLERLRRMDGALEAVSEWWDRIYPPDVYTGESGDVGAVEVVRIRGIIQAALAGEVQNNEAD